MSAAAFDSIAASYDELWTGTAIGRAQREQVWRHVDPLFGCGDRVLDVGCGTGEDAAHFVALGVAVHAIDPSPAMVEMARRRGGFAVEAGGFGTDCGVSDGAISNFGALNCVPDLASAARNLERAVRPGGHAAICLIGRFCLWESLYYCARFQFRKAFRRMRGSACSSLGITIHYPTVKQTAAAFAPRFRLRQWMGIGLFVPPSYVPLPAPLVRWCAALDRSLAHLPGLRALADHRLLIFERT